MTANVDTFEHDIAEEIKSKEATITDIASAGGEVTNTPNTGTSRILITLGGFSILAILVLFVTIFIVYNKNATPNTAVTPSLPDTNTRLLAISPSIYGAIGGNIVRVIKSEYGYSMSIVEYTPVFAYMIKNEDAYADELALAVNAPRDMSTTTSPFLFSDVTLNNQNMRVGISGESSVVYAFVNASTLLVSSSTQGIIALRGAILR